MNKKLILLGIFAGACFCSPLFAETANDYPYQAPPINPYYNAVPNNGGQYYDNQNQPYDNAYQNGYNGNPYGQGNDYDDYNRANPQNNLNDLGRDAHRYYRGSSDTFNFPNYNPQNNFNRPIIQQPTIIYPYQGVPRYNQFRH
ncbi:MAG: hypothetical protein WC782_11100 [Methylococcaceae bacterium]